MSLSGAVAYFGHGVMLPPSARQHTSVVLGVSKFKFAASIERPKAVFQLQGA